MNIEGLEPETQQLISQFNKVINDPKSRQNFINNPSEGLKQMGLTIDGLQQEALTMGLQNLALAHNFDSTDKANTGTKPQNTQSLHKASDFEKYFHWHVGILGCQLRIDHEAIKQLPGPIDAIGLLAGVTFGVVKAAGVAGPNAVVVALGLAYWGAIFTAYVITLPLLDQGKGVYLTVSWPQIGIAAASGGLLAVAALPVPTTVV